MKKIKSIYRNQNTKLKQVRPVTISQASRISGVFQVMFLVLLIYMGR
jgi:tRNA uridine 5-carboxymethylaminomethyl modification enzyme